MRCCGLSACGKLPVGNLCLPVRRSLSFDCARRYRDHGSIITCRGFLDGLFGGCVLGIEHVACNVVTF